MERVHEKYTRREMRRVTVRIAEEDFEAINAYCDKYGTSKQALVEDLFKRLTQEDDANGADRVAD